MSPKVKAAIYDNAEHLCHEWDPMDIGEMAYRVDEEYDGEEVQALEEARQRARGNGRAIMPRALARERGKSQRTRLGKKMPPTPRASATIVVGGGEATGPRSVERNIGKEMAGKMSMKPKREMQRTPDSTPRRISGIWISARPSKSGVPVLGKEVRAAPYSTPRQDRSTSARSTLGQSIWTPNLKPTLGMCNPTETPARHCTPRRPTGAPPRDRVGSRERLRPQPTHGRSRAGMLSEGKRGAEQYRASSGKPPSQNEGQVEADKRGAKGNGLLSRTWQTCAASTHRGQDHDAGRLDELTPSTAFEDNPGHLCREPEVRLSRCQEDLVKSTYTEQAGARSTDQAGADAPGRAARWSLRSRRPHARAKGEGRAGCRMLV